MEKNAKGSLGLLAVLLCTAPATMAAANSFDTVLEMHVYKTEFTPKESVRLEISTKGFVQVFCKFPSWISVNPIHKDGLRASLTDNIMRWDVSHPYANLTIPLSAALPTTPNARYTFLLSGITPENRMATGSLTIATSAVENRQAAAPLPLPVTAPTAEPSSETVYSVASANGLQANPQVTSTATPSDGGIFSKTRLQVNASYLQGQGKPYEENGLGLGWPRSFTNVDGTLFQQYGDSALDWGLTGGLYRSHSLISKNPELVASFGRTVYRVGPALRWHNKNTAFEGALGGNLPAPGIDENNFLSASLKWDQRIGNSILKKLGLGPLFPKWYALGNSMKATLNGGSTFDSWSVRNQLDIPIPILINGDTQLAVSVGTTWNAIWDPDKKTPSFNSSNDLYPWFGITISKGGWLKATPLASWAPSYKDSAKPSIGLGGNGMVTLEGGNRKIVNVNESDVPDVDEE